MKNGKNPTLKHKQAIKAARLNPDNWLVFKIESDRIHIIHRYSDTTKTVFMEG
ncbi:hypothetical protein [Paenibacillus sp. Marseille-Q4541]|uniref:DUF6906 family protein n=1 Tax=Paenibacillus sp. Marseille-Q4541 TaxID=2831522 RepID=UPI001BA64A56|nr:hypothetical protein [Paenibacillus sp. Marseille-Q4541]